MPPSALPRDHRYTWTEYRTWPDDERWEIIDGVAYNMSAAPSTRHQIIAGNLFALLYRHLAEKGCRPFIAPTDVRLSETDVVQPDILVVCDPGKITPSHIEGPPEMVVEIHYCPDIYVNKSDWLSAGDSGDLLSELLTN